MFGDPAALERIAGSIAIIIVLAVILLTVLWVFVPFSIFGIKDLMKKNLKEQERTNELLEAIGKELSTREPRKERRDEERKEPHN